MVWFLISKKLNPTKMERIYWYSLTQRVITNNPNLISKPVRLDNAAVSEEAARITARELGFTYKFDENFGILSAIYWIEENELAEIL
jgi:hypothetical protein